MVGKDEKIEIADISQFKLQNSDIKKSEIGSNDSFNNYTKEIYDGLKKQNSIDRKSSEKDEFEEILRSPD